MAAKIHERIASLEGRLNQLRARQQRAQARTRTVQNRTVRREDTRRKILIGAVVLARLERGLLEQCVLEDWLEAAVLRPEDRALFGVPADPRRPTAPDSISGSK